jgi:hypothetical protein
LADAQPGRGSGLSDETVLALLFGVTLVARALAFPFTENLYGDAVVRTEIAEHWLAAPKFITSFSDYVCQFGPLHTYYLAAFLKVWSNREVCSRLSSMVVGLLTIWPLYRLTLREFGRTAAIWAGLAFSLWGLHIQSSTTAGSEALGLCVFAFAVDALGEGLSSESFGPLARSAFFLNLGCAVRYDLWLYVPLFTLAVAMWGTDRIASVTKAVMFAGLASVFPLFWMEGNERALGDSLYPIHFIDQFHKTWTQSGIAWLGAPLMRLWGLVFWPGTLVLTLSPLYGLLCLAGMVRAFREKRHRMLAVFAVVPTLYFTCRAAVLLDFSPLARFTVSQVFLGIPYAYFGFTWFADRWASWARRTAVIAVAAVGVATPAIIAVMSYHVDSGWGNTLKPVSPVSTMPQIQMQVAHWLRDHVPAGESLVVDYDDAYTDIGVAFFSNIPEEHLVRSRWDDFPQRIAKNRARYLILLKKGKLLGRPEVKLEGAQLASYGIRYHRIQSFQGDDFQVFEADPG